MTLREKLYDGLDMVAVVTPVSPDVLAALPDALAAHAAHPAGRALRRRPAAAGRWRHRRAAGIEALARACVVVHDVVDGAPMAPAELALTCQRAGYRALPIAIHVSGPSLAVMYPHDLFDGTSGWDQFERIMEQLTTAPTSALLPRQRFPILAALRAAGLLDRHELTRVRAVRRAAERGTLTAPQSPVELRIDAQRRADGLCSIWIDAELKQRLRDGLATGAVPGRPRESLNMLLTGLVLEGVGGAVSDEHDFRIRMNVDLRRYAPRGRRVPGPFSTSYPIGTLRTTDTDPVALGVGLVQTLESRGPLWALVANLLGYVRGRVRHPLAGPPRPSGRQTFDLGLSILPARLPEGFWAPGEPVNAVLLLHPRLPTDPYVQIAHVDGGLSISLWDESGLIDADAFATSVRAAVERHGRSGVA